MADATFVCIEKCMMDHRLYYPGKDRVVRPEDWDNSNFEKLSPANILGKTADIDQKVIGAIPGQGPSASDAPVGGPAATATHTEAELIGFLKDNKIKVPAGATLADLEALAAQVRESKQA